MKKVLSLIAKYWPFLAILVVEGILFWKNYSPGTWLTGWDSTQPELNFAANLERTLTSVWQEYRGLGIVDGMAHAANLILLGYIWILSNIVPSHLIRYLFVGLMHVLGGLGVYELTIHLLAGKRRLVNQLVSLAGALFYMLSPATIQMYYIPLELFVVHYGFLPWLFLTLSNYLKTGKRTALKWMILANLLAIPQAHVPTIYIVYAAGVALFLLFHMLRKRTAWKRVLVVVTMQVAVNAIWGFPYIYTALQSANVINNAKINRLSNPEIVLRNKAYGDFRSVALLRGFSLDYGDWREEGTFDYQMSQWRNHLFSPWAEGVGWGVFAVALLGIVSIMKGRWKQHYPIIGIFLMGFITLGTKIPFISLFSEVLNRYVPFYEEAFRFSFTKFSIIYSLSLSILFCLGLRGLQSWMRLKLLAVIFSTVVMVALIYLGWPAFQGYFYYDRLKLHIPQEYFQLFELMNKPENQGRIALLPQPSLFGWEYTSWGYRGSGIIWQGIANPTLHRAFDPWSQASESYFNELTYAIQRSNEQGLKEVFDKYDVAFALIDTSIIAPGQGEAILKIPETTAMINDIGAKEVFREGALTLFDLRRGETTHPYVQLPQMIQSAQGDTSYARKDVIFADHGFYMNDDAIERIYPFADLMREEVDGITYTPTDDDALKVSVMREIPATTEQSKLVIPEIPLDSAISVPLRLQYQGSEILLTFKTPIDVKVDEQSVDLPGLPQLFVRTDQPYQEIRVELNSQVVELSQGEESTTVIPLLAKQPFTVKVYDESQRRSMDLQKAFLESDFNQCWTREGADWEFESKTLGERWVLRTKDAAVCTTLKLGQFGRDMLVTVSVPFRSDTGARPHFCVIAEGGNYQCEHDDIFYTSNTSSTWVDETRQMTLSGDKNYLMDVVARPSDNAGEEWEIEYQAPKVEFIPLVTSVSFSPDVWKDFMGENRIVLEGGAKKLNLEFIQNPLRTDVTVQGRITRDNCDVFKRGWTERSTTAEGVSYRTGQKGALCDFFEPNGVSSEKSYLLRVVGDNRKGRGLKVYVHNNATDHNDVEVLLGEEHFDRTVTLFPVSGIEDRGFLMTTEARSFGEEESEVLLKNIEAYETPLSWLARWVITAGEDSHASSVNSDVELIETQKIGPYLYSLKARVLSEKGMLVLTQGFENGWKAYIVSNTQSQGIARLFPQLGGKRIHEHVLVNGWANGWLIGQGTHSVVMVFMPQYLEYLGFLILAGLLVILLFPGRGFTWFRKAGETLYTTIVRITGKAA